MVVRALLAIAAALAAVGVPASGAEPARRTLTGAPPVVIAHRGASGYLPEHTLAAYRLAIEQGADFIEPDLVITRDGVLIARHENALAIVDAKTGALIEATTNVHTLPAFAARRTTRTIDGKPITGWFAEDFTLAEIRTLRARERIPAERPANVAHDDRHPIPTFQEVIDLARERSGALGRTIGVYPETKHPGYFASIGLPLEPPLLRTLEANGWNRADAPVWVQSFETANLRAIRALSTVKLVQLINAGGRPRDFAANGDPRTYADLVTPAGLREIATYAQAIGPHKHLVIPRTAAGTLAGPTTLVADAHAAGLAVHPWTFRSENAFLPLPLRSGLDRTQRGDGRREIALYVATGIDGFFTDHPDVGVAAVRSPR